MGLNNNKNARSFDTTSASDKVMLVDDVGNAINALNPLPATAVITGDLNVDTNSIANTLIGKSVGGDFTTAYLSGTTITIGAMPFIHTFIADDIVLVQQASSLGIIVETYTRDDTTMSVAGGTVLTITGATFSAGDTFVIHTNISRTPIIGTAIMTGSTPVTIATDDHLLADTGAILLDTDAIKTAVETLDNAVDGNYLNTNINIAGIDVASNAGVLNAQTQRITIATDDEVNNLLNTIDTDTGVIAVDTTSIDSKIPNKGTAIMTGSTPVTIATDDITSINSKALTDDVSKGVLKSIGDIAAGESLVNRIGQTSDLAVAAGAVGSISAKLRRLTQGIEDLKTNIIIAAGTALLGKVGIDQTTPGTTNNVYVTNMKPDGTNLMPSLDAIGRAGFFKQTDGTNVATVDAANTGRNATTIVQPIQHVDATGKVQPAGEVITNPVFVNSNSGLATTPNEYNVVMTNADTEYSQILPTGTKIVTFRCRNTGYDIRYAWTTGKVSGSVSPFQTLMAGESKTIEKINVTSKTLYIACSTAAQIIEIECWI